MDIETSVLVLFCYFLYILSIHTMYTMLRERPSVIQLHADFQLCLFHSSSKLLLFCRSIIYIFRMSVDFLAVINFSIVLRTWFCSIFYSLRLLSPFSCSQTLDFLLILADSCFQAPVCSWRSHRQSPVLEWFAGAKGGVCCWDLHSNLSVEVGEVQVKPLRGELFSVSWRLKGP